MLENDNYKYFQLNMLVKKILWVQQNEQDGISVHQQQRASDCFHVPNLTPIDVIVEGYSCLFF